MYHYLGQQVQGEQTIHQSRSKKLQRHAWISVDLVGFLWRGGLGHWHYIEFFTNQARSLTRGSHWHCKYQSRSYILPNKPYPINSRHRFGNSQSEMLPNNLIAICLNHFVLMEICSVYLLVACLSICTGFKEDSFRETHLWEHFGRIRSCSHNVSQEFKRISRFSDPSPFAWNLLDWMLKLFYARIRRLSSFAYLHLRSFALSAPNPQNVGYCMHRSANKKVVFLKIITPPILGYMYFFCVDSILALLFCVGHLKCWSF